MSKRVEQANEELTKLFKEINVAEYQQFVIWINNLIDAKLIEMMIIQKN